MREIKFRAWERNKMIYNPCVSDLENSGATEVNPAIRFFDGVLMQFTGLLDKDKKEIYEGDIVQYGCEDGIAIAQIVFDENEDEGAFLCGFKCVLLNIIDYPDDEYDPRELEVIGNIYENPELIKEVVK